MNTTVPLTSHVGSLPPKSWSMVTWASLAAFSVILSYLITFVLGLASLLFGLSLLLGMLKGGLSLIGVLLAVFTLMIGGTVFWSLLPRKIPVRDQRGRNLSWAMR